MSKRVQTAWSPPLKETQAVLKLYNSLTRRKEEFVPISGRKVTWYNCGPTVYDASHMGHARSYITFDILRRILSDYFGYHIFYVMNITDIDDKIIKRARQNYLFDKYVAENNSLEQIIADSKKVLDNVSHKAQNTFDPDKKDMYQKVLDKYTKSIESLESAIKCNDVDTLENSQNDFLLSNKDPLSEWLDSKLGGTVTDNAIFTALPKHWENEFMKDMDALNILRPDTLTRVSEYIPQIIAYIEKIVSNGFAYQANGSVYFNVGAFDKEDTHFYAKLVPEAYGDTNSLQEGEGDLQTADQRNEKHSQNDFALWKKSKPGEPSWESPWGLGRPGWHIECSAMASAIFGPFLDIHSGGVDLKFPHHDNEIAQSEAYFGNPTWVNYFLHSGHLTIAGCKMSKSLKNFISIQDALAQYTARQLRFAFLLHAWRDTLDYSQNTMENALQYEKMFSEFLLNVKCAIRGKTDDQTTMSLWGTSEIELNNKFLITTDLVHTALCDNIDTRTVLESLKKLVTSTNIYMSENKVHKIQLLQDIAAYVGKMLKIFGTNFEQSLCGESNLEETVMPYLTALAEFRDKVRNLARNLKATDILNECDILRDDVMPNLGVRLEDKEGASSDVKLVDKNTLMREKEAKRIIEEAKALEKERKKAELAVAQAAKDAQRKVPPHEMFLSETEKYSKFDDKGFPTHDIEGKEVSKGQVKKLQKLYQAQEKKYQEYLISQNS